MQRLALFLAVPVVAVATLAGCVPIEPKAECAKTAFDCDQSLEQPFNSFGENDQTFGTAGTCWQNEETAKACVAECNKFTAEQLAHGQAAKNNAVIVGCGGDLE